MSGITIEKVNETTTIFKITNGSLNVTVKQGDLGAELCDAIVNPTNENMNPNGGLDSKIHTVMGKFFTDQVTAVSEEMEGNACPVGQSRIFVGRTRTNPKVARFVINTVGPAYTPASTEKAAFYLQSCYSTSFALANAYGLTSIAYPAISCGAFRYPPAEAAQVGIESIRQYAVNVKDVRFILFERNFYEIFVNEWTAYAQKVNETSAVPAHGRDRLRLVPKTSLESLNSVRCSLCNGKKPLATGKILCVDCSQLARSDLFDNFLQRLRNASEGSFQEIQRVCGVLQPILNYYPIAYTPARKYDHSIHKRDAIAEHYVQSHCDYQFRTTMPMAVVGDGNCFYNTFVKLGGAGTTIETSAMTPVELRARNVVELVLRMKEYKTKYQSLEPIFDDFEKYVQYEMVLDTNYAAIWDLLSISTVLNINVISVYPKVNGTDDIYYQLLNNKTFKPLTSSGTIGEDRVVKLLFSHCNKPVNFGVKKENWTPNHFVPLLSLR
ncbi:unnamed protein product [Rotaria magnacalcarata]|uniref:Macro domain-containing protein n=1 Tax=Rotaria magnacalcarata TaxID=392030 RepID=A0A816QZN2_9BILA|nr:unnamed protein product [Rotaria magnacalcarata]CAF1607009.1 unnamed protein product [Rotaria magnacalcarata]CAF2067618.1 unnamed protein product [Rotaria magnacalcarata]CAF3895287.1 unnamed protein product [Rotaria magnacalcarata]CAF4245614.1 unnamed protein product [Rotaria magnacalcarata]